MNNLQQPREYDAVLGGNSPSLEGAAVLGGIDGVKLRLENPDAKVRIAALEQALNYEYQGVDLVIELLKDESVEVQLKAYSLLVAWTKKHEIPDFGLLYKIGKFIFKTPKHQNSQQRLIEKVNQALRDSDAHFDLGFLIKVTRLIDELTAEKLRIATEKLKTKEHKKLEDLNIQEERAKHKIRQMENAISSMVKTKKSIMESKRRFMELERSLMEAKKATHIAALSALDTAQRLEQKRLDKQRAKRKQADGVK